MSIHRTAAACASALLLAAASPAWAIECAGQFQIVKGQKIATPYCEDGYLAKIARGYGSKVSADEIRYTPGRKAEICRFIGTDHRLLEICAGHYDTGSDR